jgi:hypothetical protein
MVDIKNVVVGFAWPHCTNMEGSKFTMNLLADSEL